MLLSDSNHEKTFADNLVMKDVKKGAYKKLQELEDPLVCENIERVSSQRVNYRQSVDLVLQQR